MEGTSLLSNRNAPRKASFIQFLREFWPICFISFGGPQAHVALLHNKFVDVVPGYDGPKVKESTFLELYSVTQALPGPGSTQLVTSLGALFGGLAGGFITFLIWHLPGFICMTAAGVWFHRHLNDPSSIDAINILTDFSVGLIAAAFSFVLIAVFKIVSNTCAKNHLKMVIALISMFIAVTIPPSSSSWVFILLLVFGGFAFLLLSVFNRSAEQSVTDIDDDWEARISPIVGIILIGFVVVATVVIALLPDSDLGYRVLKMFWRIGLVVFGGGVVVIPMLIK